MLRLPDTELPAQLREALAELQREVDSHNDYADRVTAADQLWQHRTRNQTFANIREILQGMCWGNMRCGYCEDSAATQLEHVRPKSIYPDHAFVWLNFLFACSGCNGPKSNCFYVFAEGTGEIESVGRSRHDPIKPPRSGEPLLIHPRLEDALEFMYLDLETFHFVGRARPDTRAYNRADYTIKKILRLNREPLPEIRESAYHAYLNALEAYIAKRDAGQSENQLQMQIWSLRRIGHPFVWAEMRRQRTRCPELGELFHEAPEALHWEPARYAEILAHRRSGTRV